MKPEAYTPKLLTVFREGYSVATFRADHLHQRIDDTANLAVGCFHPLDGRKREACQFGELALVDPEKGARGAHLLRRNHISPLMCQTSFINLNTII